MMWQSILFLLYVSIGYGFLSAVDKHNGYSSGLGGILVIFLWPMLVIMGITVGIIDGVSGDNENE